MTLHSEERNLTDKHDLAYSICILGDICYIQTLSLNVYIFDVALFSAFRVLNMWYLIILVIQIYSDLNLTVNLLC